MTAARVLVTGGEGFIGAHLCRRLADEGHEVHVLSRPNPSRRWKLLDLFGVSCRLHAIDLLDAGRVKSVVNEIQPARVFHLAARVDLERSPAIARACIQDNVAATVNLLDAVTAVPTASVVFASTTEVYGAGPVPFREDQPLDPPSPYAVSKVAGESFCRLWARLFGCPTRIVRVGAAYGPGQPLERVIPSVIRAGLRHEPVVLRSPDHRRDYLFVSDVVDGLVRAAVRPLAAGEVVNLGTADPVAIRDVASAVLTAMGADPAAVRHEGGRANEPPCLATDAGKARTVLEWRPRVGLADGLARTIAWYREVAAGAGGP